MIKLEGNSPQVSFPAATMTFIPSLFIVFLFSSTASALYPFKEVCSSSCGQIQNIRPPFRLKGDPDYCGDPVYELICAGNSTILNLSVGKYYVSSISFNPNELQIVDAGSASGGCRLPLGSLTARKINKGGRYKLTSSNWASFVNCTSFSRHNSNYRPVPCLSQNSSFVYVLSGYQVKELEPSCGFMAMVPTIGLINGSSDKDAFELLQRGFTISWTSNPKTFGYCFAAYFRYGNSFLQVIQKSNEVQIFYSSSFVLKLPIKQKEKLKQAQI